MKINLKLISAFVFLILTEGASYAEGRGTAAIPDSWKITRQEIRSFIENKGQFSLPSSLQEKGKVYYVFDGKNERYYFTEKGVIYEFTHKTKVQLSPEEKQAREERKRQGFASHEEWIRFEKETKRITEQKDYLVAEWVGILPSVQIKPLEKDPFYHSYSFYDENGEMKNICFLSSYKKLLYKSAYPGIDILYEFHPEKGIKYSLIIAPGSNINTVKLRYSKDLILENGEIIIPTLFGPVIDHRPVCFYKEEQNKKIESHYVLTDKNTLQFQVGTYETNKTFIIDPWTQTPNFPSTNWDCVWECERDGNGNVYVIGGTTPLQLIKYNSAGALQWIYNTPYDTTEWLGTFATDLAGNSYVANGSPARIHKVSTAGALVWNNSNPGGILALTEFWNITFNCDQTQLVIAGTDGPALGGPLPYIFNVDMNTGNILNSVQVHGGGSFQIPPNDQEVRSITACKNGKYYFLTHDSIGYIHQSLGSCSAGSGFPFHVNSGIDLGYKCENYRYNNSGIMALAYYNGYVYVHRGNQLQKRNFNNASIVATANIPGGSFTSQFGGNYVGCSGIDIDDCGYIYVGSTTAVHKFDQNLNLITSYPVSFNVYDVEVNTNGEVIACGSTGNANSNARTGYIQSIAASACQPQSYVCCDASICNPTALCLTDPPLTLTSATAGGSWSASCGTCITSGGVFNPATAGQGTHTIYYTLPCGTDSVQITVNNCTPMVVCKDANNNLIVSGGTGPYSWQQPDTIQDCSSCFFGLCNNIPPGCIQNIVVWQTFATGNSIPAPGSYPIQVVDNAGNIVTINNLAAVPNCSSVCPPLTLNLVSLTQPLCNGGTGSASVSMSGSTATFSYTWNPGNLSGATQNNLLPGTYTVIGLDSVGCGDTLAVTINNPPAINISIQNITPVSCGGTNDGSATVVASGGTGSLSYTWNTSPPQNGPTATNLAAGTYTVTVTDANNCQNSLQITIPNSGPVTASIYTSSTTLCVGDTLHLIGSGGSNYTWQVNGNTIGNSSLLIISPSSTTTYLLIVSDGSCVDSANVTIIVNSAPVADASVAAGILCEGQTLNLTATPNGMNGYSWVGPNGYSSAQQNPTVNNITTNYSGWYYLTVTDGNGCSGTDSVQVVVNANPVVTVWSNSPVCEGDTLNLFSQPNGMNSYSWTGPNGYTSTQQNPAISNVSMSNGGTYTVTVTDGNGCQGMGSVNVVISSPPTASISGDLEICKGESTVLTAGGGSPYEWLHNGSNSQSVTVSPAQTTSYSVVVGSGNCRDTAVVTVVVNSQPQADAWPDTVIVLGQSVTLSATGGVNYVWSPAIGLSCVVCANPIATPEYTTNYCVWVTDDNGCKDTACVRVVVELKCGEVYVPNVFSPNGDGQNDVLRVYGNCIKELSFALYDRWGEKVFETNDPQQTWDGVYRGKAMNGAVFHYKLKATLKDGSIVERKGTVTVVR